MGVTRFARFFRFGGTLQLRYEDYAKEQVTKENRTPFGEFEIAVDLSRANYLGRVSSRVSAPRRMWT